MTERGADRIAHPGGTLLGHLVRVADRLATYGADERLQLAGLTHAAYSTDGFDTALLDTDERALLDKAIGTEAEALVYRYGATDRRPFYRQLDQPLVVWTDRFTGQNVTLDPPDVTPLMTLTVANELDVIEQSAHLLEQYGPSLADLFTRAQAVLPDGAWADVVGTLGLAGGT